MSMFDLGFKDNFDEAVPSLLKSGWSKREKKQTAMVLRNMQSLKF